MRRQPGRSTTSNVRTRARPTIQLAGLRSTAPGAGPSSRRGPCPRRRSADGRGAGARRRAGIDRLSTVGPPRPGRCPCRAAPSARRPRRDRAGTGSAPTRRRQRRRQDIVRRLRLAKRAHSSSAGVGTAPVNGRVPPGQISSIAVQYCSWPGYMPRAQQARIDLRHEVVVVGPARDPVGVPSGPSILPSTDVCIPAISCPHRHLPLR